MSGKIKAFVAVLILAAAGAAAAYYFTVLWPGPPEKAVQEEQSILWEGERTKLREKIGELQDELAVYKESAVSAGRLEEVFGKDAADLARADVVRTCQDMDRQVRGFFSYLDRQPYIRHAGLEEEGAYTRYLRIVDALSRNPPLILEETKDHYSLVKNVAHFFRVLGRQDVLLIRRTLAEESEILDPLAALFYDWTVSTDRCKDGVKGRASLETLYEYAAFFLNTLAGKSYLLRRDSRVRTLTTYYCVLTLDLANRETLNRYGIDIRPVIDRSIQDIRNQRGLLFAKEYLDTLEELKSRYTLR